MRGLPSCGKSHTARRLAATGGAVFETDEYFYTQVGDDPAVYEYNNELLPAARAWNIARFQAAIAQAITPIVVDRGNGLNLETREYAASAMEHGYRVELVEPNSPWWQELRVLLKYKQHIDEKLFDSWAKYLADSSQDTHRVPVTTIRHWMASWRHDLTVEQILACGETGK